MLNKANSKKQHVFIIGCKGIPATYGGFETFVEKLTLYRKNNNIQYHIACMADSKNCKSNENTYIYNEAICYNIKIWNMGSAKAVIYDINALMLFIAYVKKSKVKNPIFYILACRIGPFIGHFKKQIKAIGGHLFVNPDGHEWKRAKWSTPVRSYWKMSEKFMIKHAELVICDSLNIEKYILEVYKKYHPKTMFIAYGAEIRKSNLAADDERLSTWYQEKNIVPKSYYLAVGRFVPENNYETMIKEFMKSKTDRAFVLITNATNKFLSKLEKKTGFDNDPRIKFVGTVYDQELLMKIHENAYGYFHGHEVGGTNPSLLGALSSTKLNLLLDVVFNREVAEDAAIYWSKEEGDLANLIEKAEHLSFKEISALGKKAKKRITDWYSWEYIIYKYEKCFDLLSVK